MMKMLRKIMKVIMEIKMKMITIKIIIMKILFMKKKLMIILVIIILIEKQTILI